MEDLSDEAISNLQELFGFLGECMYFAFILEHLCFSSEFSAIVINFVYLNDLVNYMY